MTNPTHTIIIRKDIYVARGYDMIISRTQDVTKINDDTYQLSFGDTIKPYAIESIKPYTPYVDRSKPTPPPLIAPEWIKP